MVSKPMRIAQIVGSIAEGGVESFLLSFYKNIDRNQIQFDFFVEDSPSKIIVKSEIEKMGGKVYFLPTVKHLHSFNKELKHILKRENYQIVHCHMNTLNVFPLRIAKKCGVPHRISHSHSTSNKKELIRNLIKSILRRFSHCYATEFAACSKESAIYQFGKKAFNSGRVTLINSAIDYNRFKFDQEGRTLLRSKLGVSDKIVIGTIGRLCKTKNQLFLIKLFKRVYSGNNNYYLIIVGNGALEDKIRKYISRNKLENCVTLITDIDKIETYYSSFDIFVLPSLYEGLSLVTLEAQSSGCTTIVSSNVPHSTNVSNNVQYLPLKLDAWVNVLSNCQINKNRENCYECIKNSKFNLEVAVQNLVDYYLEFYK